MSNAVLALTVALMLVVLVLARDLFTIAVVVAVGAFTAAVLYWGPGWLHVSIACLETWLLLLGGFVHIAELTLMRYRDGASVPTDGEDFADETGDACPGLDLRVVSPEWLVFVAGCDLAVTVALGSG